MKSIQSIINRDLPEFVIRRKADRRNNVVVTYIDGNGKSGQYYAALYAEENRIQHDSIVSPDQMARSINDFEKNGRNIDAIIVVDDIAATGKSLTANLMSFLKTNIDCISGGSSIPLYIVTVAATSNADQRIRDNLARIKGIEADFRTCEIIDEKYFAFADGSLGIWASEDERSRAKSLCTDLGSKIYRSNPLGYGGFGMLVVFPSTCPNNALPILHSSGRLSDDKRWEPLFPRFVN